MRFKPTTWCQIRVTCLKHVAWGLAIVMGVGLPARAADGEWPVLAAASSLNPALMEVARAFTHHTGQSVRLSFGASGNIARQILQGAPFELFFSADERHVHTLVGRSLTLDAGSVYAVGRLVVYVPNGASVTADAELRDLTQALDEGRLRRLAIPNPEHAPYGVAAEQLLRELGLWQRLVQRLVFGENVAQTAQFATTGSVDAAIFALSAALAPVVSQRGTWAVLPGHLHEPIRHRMVLLQRAGPTARAFYAFMDGAPARQIMGDYGFMDPKAPL